VAFPGRDRPAARPVRRSALYGRLREGGAVFEQMFGWERPLWFAREGTPPEHVNGFRRTVMHEMIAHEVNAVRERVGVLDLSGFGKIDICGPDAAAFLDRLTTNRLPRSDGGIALTYLLNKQATIEAELTCTRLAADRFFLLFAALDETRVLDWLSDNKRASENVILANRSDEIGCLLVAGPSSRDTIGCLTDADLSSGRFRPLTGREISIAGCAVRALRVSLVGELGWELHARMEDLPALYDALHDVGAPFGIEDFGTAALNGMRFEKAFKGTRELNGTSSLVETGMMRFAKFDKGDFVGRSALLQKAETVPTARCVYLDVETGDSDCHGSEAVFREGRIVGSVSSGAFGPTVQRSLAFAFVEADSAHAGTELDLMLLGELRRARVRDGAAYDPTNERVLM
jgi:dimethylglycine dehydrogenase